MLQQQSLLPVSTTPTNQRVVRIEKNLNSLGFFSPTASTGKRSNEKVVKFVRELPGGAKTEAKATIMGTSRGLPNTADLDKYIAFQLIVAEIKKAKGTVCNPIGFTTYQLLKLLGLKPTGKRYAEVDQWLDRMAGTMIKSEGAVYFAKKKQYARDRFHVFDRVFTVGQELPDGSKAEQNYVFLSEWQLENLNHSYVLPIALEFYQKLRTDIAKNLVPMLYIWFYATPRPIHKRYRDLCQHLNVKIWTQVSRAKEQFSPALEELQEVGYLSEWDLRRTMDDLDFKLVFAAGPIFRERWKEGLRPWDDTDAKRQNAIVDQRFNRLVEALVERGVAEKMARRVLFGVPSDQAVEEQLEWIDAIVRKDGRKIENPAGMYVSFVRDGVTPPAGFVSSRRRKEMEEQERLRRTAETQAAARQLDLEIRYNEYRESQVDAYVGGLKAESRAKLLKEARKDAGKHVNGLDMLSREQQESIVNRCVFGIAIGEISLLTIDEFQASERFEQLTLSSEGR
jgi:hypothetical protein